MGPQLALLPFLQTLAPALGSILAEFLIQSSYHRWDAQGRTLSEIRLNAWTNEVMEDHVCSCFFFVRGPAFFRFFCKKNHALENQFTVIVVVRCFLNLSMFFSCVLVAFLRFDRMPTNTGGGDGLVKAKNFSPKVSNGKFLQPLELGDETDMMRYDEMTHTRSHLQSPKITGEFAAIPKNLVTFILLLPRKKKLFVHPHFGEIIYALGCFCFFCGVVFLCRKSHQKLEIHHSSQESRPRFGGLDTGGGNVWAVAKDFRRTFWTGLSLLKFSEVNFHTTTVGGGQLKHFFKFISRSLQKMIQFDYCIFFQMGWEKENTN